MGSSSRAGQKPPSEVADAPSAPYGDGAETQLRRGHRQCGQFERYRIPLCRLTCLTGWKYLYWTTENGAGEGSRFDEVIRRGTSVTKVIEKLFV